MKLLDNYLKTNWKYLATVAVLALVVVAILGLQYLRGQYEFRDPHETQIIERQKQEQERTIQESNINRIDTSNWQIYRNEEFGFEFSHPLGTSVRTDATYSKNSIATYIIFKKDGFHQTIFVYKKPSGESLLNWYNTNFSGITVAEGPTARIINGYEGLEVVKGSLEIMKSVFIEKNDTIIEFLFSAKASGGFITVDQQSLLDSFRFVEPLDTSTWQTYRNEEFGFEVKYPRSWELGGSGTTRVFLFPSGPAREALFMQFEKKTINLEEFISEYNQQGPDFQIVEEETIEFAGKMATRLSGTSITGVNHKFLFVPLGQQTFIIRYQDIDEIQLQILSTFRFIE